ncbi:hypothetical protein K2X30_08695 [bacterium]|nr:hypothetical protein [bacterium]
MYRSILAILENKAITVQTILTLAGAAALLLHSQNPQADPGFEVHEWGTFTSLQDPRGKMLTGMHYDDEKLPDFVHSREKDATAAAGSRPFQLVNHLARRPSGCEGKGCDFALDRPEFQVTQKMETPVIYFYSQQERDVQVNVKFPGGLITQWFPQAASYAPAAGAAQSLAGGDMTWNVHVSNQTLPVPATAPDSIWNPSREVQANYITAGGENERLIFYRGLGNFGTGLTIDSTDGKGALRITNSSLLRVPSAILIRVTDQGGAVVNLGSLSPGSNRVQASAASLRNVLPMNEYLAQATQMVQVELEKSGLFPLEAQAMVNTWKQSYFLTPGYRLLYVLPRDWTDGLLPMQVTPAPTKLVRTLVGRVEIFGRVEQRQLIQALQADQIGGGNGHAIADVLGRFAEPKLRSALEEASTTKVIAEYVDYLQALIDRASQQ